MADLDQQIRGAARVGALIRREVELDGKTDAQIAQALLDDVLADEQLDSTRAQLISQAITRLERAAGGPVSRDHERDAIELTGSES